MGEDEFRTRNADVTGDVPGYDPEDGVDDPEALRRAEEAVAHDDRPPGGPREHIDERWAPIANGGTGGVPALVTIASALDEAGVPVGWDPYAPSDAVGFMWPGTETRVYTVQVPESQSAHAREILPATPPAGVTYAWTAPPEAPPASAGEDAGRFGLTSGTASAPGSDTGAPLSDNRRLESLDTGGPSPILVVGRVLVVLALIALLLVISRRLLG